MNPHKPGRKPLQDENRKISVTTQVPQHVYARLLEAVNKQHRSISSAVAEGVEFVVNGGIPSGEPGPESTRGAVFGRILAATIADGRQAADALDLVQNSPEKILQFARKLPAEKSDLISAIPTTAFARALTTAEAAQMELEYLKLTRCK